METFSALQTRVQGMGDLKVIVDKGPVFRSFDDVFVVGQKKKQINKK